MSQWATEPKGPVIIYGRGGSGSNNFLREHYSRPTHLYARRVRRKNIFRKKLFDPAPTMVINNDRSLKL